MAEGSGVTGAEPWLVPAMLTKTSGELLRGLPLPTVIRDRPLIFLLGPREVGKSVVAARILGPDQREVCAAECLRKALNYAARYRRWAPALVEAPGLLLDSVECLHGRYGPLDLLGSLLRTRAEAGRRTVLCQGPTDTSVTQLYANLPYELRATVLLRFPEGRGRRRFVAERCRQRGIANERASAAIRLEPWSYAAVERFLDQLERDQDGPEPARTRVESVFSAAANAAAPAK